VCQDVADNHSLLVVGISGVVILELVDEIIPFWVALGALGVEAEEPGAGGRSGPVGTSSADGVESIGLG